MNTTLGLIKSSKELGYKGRNSYIWHACVDCGKKQWVILRNKLPLFSRCRHCAARASWKSNPHIVRRAEASPSWRGGKIKHSGGYLAISLQPDDFFYSMAYSNGYVLEHRLVMAKHLGRCLLPWEVVHHKNHIRSDNCLENLQLVLVDKHCQITILENRVRVLEQEVGRQAKRIILLEAENILSDASKPKMCYNSK